MMFLHVSSCFSMFLHVSPCFSMFLLLFLLFRFVMICHEKPIFLNVADSNLRRCM